MTRTRSGTWLVCVAAMMMTIGAARGQSYQRRASMTGGGSPEFGKCTIEVVVDGAAEVEIRGDNATLRNLGGQAPQWRRFECTSAMPPNPANFRFSGVDGRGRQELVRGPQGGGGAVVRIQDTDGGSEGYTFDVTWGGGGRQTYPNNPGRGYGDEGRGPNQQLRPSRGTDGRFTTEQVVRVCQDAVRQQAYERFHSTNIAFRKTALDDQPGRQDWITGVLDMRRGYDRDETYRFSCSVNFDDGEVRSAQIEPIQFNGTGMRRDQNGASRAAIENCERSVEDNIRQKGYQHVDFLSINVDDRSGRSDLVVGSARADVRSRSDSFSFSCSVDLRDGDVRSVEVRRR